MTGRKFPRIFDPSIERATASPVETVDLIGFDPAPGESSSAMVAIMFDKGLAAVERMTFDAIALIEKRNQGQKKS